MFNMQGSHTQPQTKRSWATAYKAFLLSKDESLILKLAPLFILLGTPEVIVSNLIPVIGEIADIGELGLLTIVAFRTYMAMQKYR